MLPFLTPKKSSSTVIVHSHDDGSSESLGEEGEIDHGVLAAAEDLIAAVHSKDPHEVAEALRAAFELFDSMPHVEGEHLGE